MLLETDSGRKKQCNTARLNTLEGVASIVPQNIFPAADTQRDADATSAGGANDLVTGTHMSQLLTNSKPIMSAISKSVPKKLSANANRMLFPLVQ